MFFRTPLIVAYHASHRPEEMNELIADTDRYFHAGGRWDRVESQIARLRAMLPK